MAADLQTQSVVQQPEASFQQHHRGGRGGGRHNNNNNFHHGGYYPQQQQQQQHQQFFGMGPPPYMMGWPTDQQQQQQFAVMQGFQQQQQQHQQHHHHQHHAGHHQHHQGHGGGAHSGGGGGRGRNNFDAADYEVDEKTPEFCKALAKVAKPRPPWSIGEEPTNDISVEIARLESFFTPSSRDKQEMRDVWDAVKLTVTELDPAPNLQYTGSNSWSFFAFRGRLSVAAPGVKDAAARAQLGPALFRNGCSLVKEFQDHRGHTAYLVEHAATKREVILRLGEGASVAAETSRAIVGNAMSAEVRSALNCIIVLLRQSKIIEDLDGACLCDEAAAVMVLSIANSYPDKPAAGRLLIDFFLTFGFKAHFDPDTLAVSIAGMVTPVAKAHREPFSILDPAKPSANLAVNLTAQKLQFLQSTFTYCYHVVSEFAKEKDPHKQRGQSPLSTILGGEPFWPRVVALAQLSVEPYVGFLQQNRNRAVDEMMKAHSRRVGGGRGGGGRR